MKLACTRSVSPLAAGTQRTRALVSKIVRHAVQREAPAHRRLGGFVGLERGDARHARQREHDVRIARRIEPVFTAQVLVPQILIGANGRDLDPKLTLGLRRRLRVEHELAARARADAGDALERRVRHELNADCR